MTEQNPAQRLADELEHDLTARYGLTLGSGALWLELGFRSPAAFRVAMSRGMVEVPVFALPNRRGRFALAKDVAAWIARQRHAAPRVEANMTTDCIPPAPRAGTERADDPLADLIDQEKYHEP